MLSVEAVTLGLLVLVLVVSLPLVAVFGTVLMAFPRGGRRRMSRHSLE